MDWFKRYGIPGVYFLVLMAAWLYALYKCWPLKLDDFVKLGVFLFLPVGYIISILGQLRYLGSPTGGLHRRAANRIEGISFVRDYQGNLPHEPDWEALSCLNAATAHLGTTNTAIPNNGKYLDSHKFIQEWIRKRMDVLVINHTIQIATVLAPFVAAAIGLTFGGFAVQFSFPLIILLVVISVAVCWIMLGSRRTLREQITIVIAGDWQEMPRRDFRENILQLNSLDRYPTRTFWLIYLPDRIYEWIRGLFRKARN